MANRIERIVFSVIALAVLLTFALGVLKLAGIISASWLIVTLPVLSLIIGIVLLLIWYVITIRKQAIMKQSQHG